MSNTQTGIAIPDSTLSKLVLLGDLSGLKPEEKVQYYKAFCDRVGLDAATRPFQLIKLNGREVLYADRGGVAQLNKKHGISHRIENREFTHDCYIVTATASRVEDGNVRQTTSIGVVSVRNKKDDELCNALMKAETKAKRRATLDLVGLGCLDETEVDGEAPKNITPLLPEKPQPTTTVTAAPVIDVRAITPQGENITKPIEAEIVKETPAAAATESKVEIVVTPEAPADGKLPVETQKALVAHVGAENADALLAWLVRQTWLTSTQNLSDLRADRAKKILEAPRATVLGKMGVKP